MNIISLENVSKSFGIKPLFEGVTFGMEESEKIGIIGANGSGKTTLLRIIAGRDRPDTGRVVIAGERAVAYLAQNPLFDEDQTVLDAVFTAGDARMRLLHDYEQACHELSRTASPDQRLLGRVADLAHKLEAAGGWELETDAKNILTRLGITDTGARMGALSGGQRKRVALAHALVTRPDLLILDEPTNHLDADTIAWLETYLQRYTGALMLVTHDRYFLDRVTGRIFEIDRGKVQSFAGSYGYYLEKKQEQETRLAAEWQKRQALVRRELAWLRRGAKARSTKQKARVERAQELIARPKEEARAEVEFAVGVSRLGKKILTLEQISKAYDGRALIDRFSYTLKRGDRIGIIGPNGSGKTTLLDIIAGRIEPDEGSVDRGQTLVLGYYDQENRELDLGQRVIDYVREEAEQIETADGSIITATQMLDTFMFASAAQYGLIGQLSGGERRRLYLLRVLMSAPNVLLLDEPTNDLDIQTLVRLEEYLDSFAGCLIVASHDRYFLDRTIEHVFRLDGEGQLRQYPGNYSAFLEARERERSESPGTEAKASKPVSKAKQTTGPRRLSYKERRELEELEARIDSLEARKAEIEARLAVSSSDFITVQALYSELEALKSQLESDVERWAELAEFA